MSEHALAMRGPCLTPAVVESTKNEFLVGPVSATFALDGPPSGSGHALIIESGVPDVVYQLARSQFGEKELMDRWMLLRFMYGIDWQSAFAE